MNLLADPSRRQQDGRRAPSERSAPFDGGAVQALAESPLLDEAAPERAAPEVAPPLQPRASSAASLFSHYAEDGATAQQAAAAGAAGGGGALPFGDRIQRSFGGHDVGGVRAHTGEAAEAASRQLGAQAYATGNDVVFGKAPDLHTAAHEAAHVVQQRRGVHLKGGVGQPGDEYERGADAVADRVVRGESAEDLLGPTTGAGAGGPAVQRKLKPDKVFPVLSNLLSAHKQEAEYQKMWRSKDVARISKEVGDLEDTDEANVKRRLTEHPDIKPLLLAHRMTLESSDGALKDPKGELPDTIDPKELEEVYQAFRSLLFYHSSKAAGDIRKTGLDPERGGQSGGLSDERSLAAKRDQNLKAAKGKVFITRKHSEAYSYAESDTSRIVMLVVPQSLHASIEVDPDSQFGLVGTDHLKGIIHPDGKPNNIAARFLLDVIQTPSTKTNFVVLWKELMTQGRIKP